MIELEICANSVASAGAAQQGGADRVELCDNMAEGGTTPSYGTLRKAREQLSLQLYPIIRPRGGDFLYTKEEFDIMLSDIKVCKELGCDGIVIGLLNTDGNIDVERTKRLVDAAGPMGVAFHRAFDRCNDPFQALEDIIICGCRRLLSSGQQPTAVAGADLLGKLVRQAGDRLTVMPGSGVRPDNIAHLIRTTGATAYHSTAKSTASSRMQYKNALAHMEDNNLSVTNAEVVRALRQASAQNRA